MGEDDGSIIASRPSVTSSFVGIVSNSRILHSSVSEVAEPCRRLTSWPSVYVLYINAVVRTKICLS